MRRRSPARWLAPLALVTCAVAVYTLVHDGKSSSDKGATTATTTARTATTTAKKKAKKAPKVYVVKSGDVLSAIAEKTGVPVAVLEQLNPTADASALHPGEKLRLSR